jgi:ribonuclease R
MRSQARLTYEGVARALGWTTEGNPNPVAEAFAKPLVAMAELTEKLRKARFARGALELTLPEARVVLDPESGAPLNVVRRGSDPGVKRAYNVVEELMLLANELVARFLSEKKIPAIFRIHGTPDPDKLTRLGEVAERLGVVFEAERMLEPKGVSQFLTRIARHPKAQVLTQLLLRSLQQAVYDVNNIGHFGLASECYVHFTSPIRRYPDLVIHRLVKSVLRGEKVDKSPAGHEHMALLAAETSRRERAAMDIEREVVDLNRALLMQNHVGDNYEGTVTALVGSGVYVSLDEPFVDVLVRFESMGPDQYQLSEDELSIVGERSGDSINLGDRIRVQIEDVQVLRRSVYGKRLPPESSSLAEQQPSAKPQARKTRTPPAPRRPAKAAARGHSQKTAKRKAPSRKIPSRKRQK